MDGVSGHGLKSPIQFQSRVYTSVWDSIPSLGWGASESQSINVTLTLMFLSLCFPCFHFLKFNGKYEEINKNKNNKTKIKHKVNLRKLKLKEKNKHLIVPEPNILDIILDLSNNYL